MHPNSIPFNILNFTKNLTNVHKLVFIFMKKTTPLINHSY